MAHDITRRHRTDPETGIARLDRFVGDALIGAMLLLGFVFFVAAARADDALPAGPPVAFAVSAQPA